MKTAIKDGSKADAAIKDGSKADAEQQLRRMVIKEPIFSLACDCDDLIRSSLARAHDEDPLKEILDEYERRFDAWWQNLGVFAEPKANLDRRLQAHPEIQDIVVRLLAILKKYLTELTERWDDFTHSELSSPFSHAKDESDSDESSSSDSKYSTGLTLKAIRESLHELSQVGIAIRQSSTTPETVRARKFIRCSRAEQLKEISFEKLSLIALGSLYPNAPRSLLIQLGKSMVDRRARHLLRKSRHETLKHDVRSHAVEPEATEQTPLSSAGSKSITLPPQTPAAQKLAPPSAAGQESIIAPSTFHPSQFAAKRKTASSAIPKHGTTMVLASKNAPPVPNFEKGEETICQWCFKTISRSLLENGGWSKLGTKHYLEDLEPFPCISEDCADTVPAFRSAEHWRTHMSQHNSAWIQHIHLQPRWRCDLGGVDPDDNEPETTNLEHPFFKNTKHWSLDTVFWTRELFCGHVRDHHSHADPSDEATLERLVERAYNNRPREPNVCPLCYMIPKGQEGTDDSPVNSSLEVSKAMADHVTEHLQNVMILSLHLIDAHALHQDNGAESFEGETNASSVKLDDQERTLPSHSAADLEISDLESSGWSSTHLVPESTGAIPETEDVLISMINPGLQNCWRQKLEMCSRSDGVADPILEDLKAANGDLGLSFHFKKILESIAETEIMLAPTSSVFVVYAHDNTMEEANSQVVTKLIDWLYKAGVNLLSDRSPFGNQITTRDFSNGKEGQDILWNQTRLIPRYRYENAADKVLLCYSKLLKKYYDKCIADPSCNRYDAKIEAAYLRTQNQYMKEQEMYDELHGVIQNHPRDDFHHVLTELALLNARKKNADTGEDESKSIIHVIVNGEYGDYLGLPFGEYPTQLAIKLSISDNPSRFADIKNEHDLFFKVLRLLSPPDHYGVVNDFFNCYSDYAETSVKDSNKGTNLSQDYFQAKSKSAIQQARQKIDGELRKRKEIDQGRLRSLTEIPFFRNSNFTGRHQELWRLFSIFHAENTSGDSKRAALCGLGGIGKTQIVVEFVYRFQKRFPEYSIFWVQANDLTSFEASYRRIASKLQVAIDEENFDIKTKLNARLSREDAGKWLMVVDNADDSTLDNHPAPGFVLSKHLPRSKFGGILFTTRDHSAATEYAKSNVVRVEKMGEQESIALLRKHLQVKQLSLLKDEAMVIKFLRLLCMLPLAIMQAANFFNQTLSMSIENYIEIFGRRKEEAVELLGEGKLDEDMDDPTKSAVATTWLISFERIEKSYHLAAEYLKFIACIKDEDIPEDLLPDTEWNALILKQKKAIGTLIGFGFLSPQPEGRLYNMHRLVHLVTQNWLESKSELSVWTDKAIGRLLNLIPDGGHESREKWVVYLPHGIQIGKSLDISADENVRRARLLHKIGRCQSSMGQYNASEISHKHALELRKKEFGEQNRATLVSMNEIGLALDNQGRYDEAEPMYRQTLQLSEKVLGKEHPSTLTSMNNLAALLRSQGRYDEAEPMYRQALQLSEKALQLSEKVLGKEHPDTLASMNNLAALFKSQLQLREKVLGKEHPDTLTSMNNLAALFKSQSKGDENRG
ncbi:hypothetical protein BP6252_01555 [Coleophoma cylindrospora]|uniref:NB-ARC domain-containing protein n=1 Tax=Coleophoma cylindrospora TaxID=1849047 RepID=A0A3D8ST68_9HELO|nr:hypothetical protein BP6252_01555 [Coleophoma cylindrospora]